MVVAKKTSNRSRVSSKRDKNGKIKSSLNFESHVSEVEYNGKPKLCCFDIICYECGYKGDMNDGCHAEVLLNERFNRAPVNKI